MTESVAEATGHLIARRSQRARGFIFDMDGVLYRGTLALRESHDLFNALTLRGDPVPAGHEQLDGDPGNLRPAHGRPWAWRSPRTRSRHRRPSRGTSCVTSCRKVRSSCRWACRHWSKPCSPVPRSGWPTMMPDEPIDAVVVGLDLDFTYAKLRRASDVVRSGATLRRHQCRCDLAP